MDNQESPSQYLIAEGPAGLGSVLDQLLQKSQADAGFAASDHYILYQLKDQQSLIKVDLSQRPFQFWYYDLLGRPATDAVKSVIADFLWEKCGEAKLYLQESA
jgi:hypothetical protein